MLSIIANKNVLPAYIFHFLFLIDLQECEYHFQRYLSNDDNFSGMPIFVSNENYKIMWGSMERYPLANLSGVTKKDN